MRDIPMFTTDTGVASLTLKEIPYKQEAYVRIHDSSIPETFLKECCDFCVAAGAEKVFATGHKIIENYKYHTAIWKMSMLKEMVDTTEAKAISLTRQTLDEWRDIYNTHMSAIPNSATMTAFDAEKILGCGEGYFVYRDDILLGIGAVSGEYIRSIISVKSGEGGNVLSALSNMVSGDQIVVEVASENERAIRFYEKLGFRVEQELSRWYQIV